jgi:hypothetical protein
MKNLIAILLIYGTGLIWAQEHNGYNDPHKKISRPFFLNRYK